MTTHTLSQGARSSAILTMGTLAADTYIASGAQDFGAAIPLDRTIEVEATPSTTPTGDKELLVFAQLSLDNTNFTSGPTSGTSNTNEPDLHLLGVLPLKDSSTHRKMFRLADLPVARYGKIVVRNKCGVSLASGYVYIAAITGSSA